MKAFAVTEDCENTGGIIFADHAIVARKWAAREYNDGDLHGIVCRRAPWADRFDGKPVPSRVMVEHGWHFECTECGERIDEDYLAETRRDIANVVGTQWSRTFCDSRCARRWWSLHRRREAQKAEAVDLYSAIVTRRFPAAVIVQTHAYVTHKHGGPGWDWQEVDVHFTLPPLQYPASYCTVRHNRRPAQACFFCAAADREAFETYAKETRS